MKPDIFYVSVRSEAWAKPYFDYFAVRNRAYKILGSRKSKPEYRDSVTARSHCIDLSQDVDLLLQDTADNDLYFTCTKDCRLIPVLPDTMESIENIAFLRGSEHGEWKLGRRVFFKLSAPGAILSSQLKWDGNGECYILKD